ncbi:MAG TPA: shikimate kinase [Thermoplasmata archaeon]|jgi:shikimate kinase
MTARATCFGAGTIVNAIATGRGAAFGLALRASAIASERPGGRGVVVGVPPGVDPALAEGCARRVLDRSGREAGLDVTVDSEIPISRGLKSSSAVANAVVLASARALGQELAPLEVINTGVEAAIGAGVTITGAFDDACASFFGGVVLTDNKARKIVKVDCFPAGLMAVVRIPRRTITKASLAGKDFTSVCGKVEDAYRLALRGDYFRALELNSAAYAPLFGIDETPAVRARAAGAVAAGVSGTGPAIIALAKSVHVNAIVRALDDGECEVRVAALNTVNAMEAIA